MRSRFSKEIQAKILGFLPDFLLGKAKKEDRLADIDAQWLQDLHIGFSEALPEQKRIIEGFFSSVQWSLFGDSRNSVRSRIAYLRLAEAAVAAKTSLVVVSPKSAALAMEADVCASRDSVLFQAYAKLICRLTEHRSDREMDQDDTDKPLLRSFFSLANVSRQQCVALLSAFSATTSRRQFYSVPFMVRNESHRSMIHADLI